MSQAVAAESVQAVSLGAQSLGTIQGKSLTVALNSDGSYSIARNGRSGSVLHSNIEADVNGAVLESSAYPQHKMVQSEFHDEFGSGVKLIVTHTGLPGKPDLVCTVRLYHDRSWGDIAVEVHNTRIKLSQSRRFAASRQWILQSSI